MERQDFINTINDLRSTIESLRMTIATLQSTIESLNADEKRHKKQASEYEEKIAALSRQCEYLESLNELPHPDAHPHIPRRHPSRD